MCFLCKHWRSESAKRPKDVCTCISYGDFKLLSKLCIVFVLCTSKATSIRLSTFPEQ